MKRIQEKNWLLIVGYANGHEEYIACTTRDEANERRNEIAARHAGLNISPAVTVITPISTNPSPVPSRAFPQTVNP